MILVNAASPVTACIETVWHDLDFFDRDVGRREGIESAKNAEPITVFFDEEIRHLTEGMDPGVGAPGAGNARWRSKKSRNRAL